MPISLQAPLPESEARQIELAFGPNITPLPVIEPLPDIVEVPVLLRLGDDVSTDTISPAGAEALPYRSNLTGLAEFSFRRHDATYVSRAKALMAAGGHALVAGLNYGQGSSREHAALCPQYLGLRVVLAKSFARIHEQNLVAAGVLPLRYANHEDGDLVEEADVLELRGIRSAVENDRPVMVKVKNKTIEIAVQNAMSVRQRKIFLAGGLINWFRQRPS